MEMTPLQEVLKKLEKHIQESTYEVVENDCIELKDLSGGRKWISFYETVCSFLNTKGGWIIIGIWEDVNHKQYKLKGYNSEFENNLKQEIFKQFKDENAEWVDVKNYIEYQNLPFLDKNIAIVTVTPLPKEKLYVFVQTLKKNHEKLIAYQRLFDEDREISSLDIQKQMEYKKEYAYRYELKPVQGCA